MTTQVSRSWRALSVVSIAAALTLFGAAGPAAAAIEPPAYYPSGPQTNVNQADLEGWTLCYSSLYDAGDPGSPGSEQLYGTGGILSELCTGEFLLLAGGPLDDPVLTVLAAAPRADVVTDTTTDTTTTHSANGSEWYFNDDLSWGFALGGDTVDKDSCDVDGDNPEYRLCFHIEGQELYGGYRAGANEGLNRSSDWTRYIYQADGIEVPEVEVPELAATGVAPTAVPYLAGGMLILGVAALVATTATRRRTA